MMKPYIKCTATCKYVLFSAGRKGSDTHCRSTLRSIRNTYPLVILMLGSQSFHMGDKFLRTTDFSVQKIFYEQIILNNRRSYLSSPFYSASVPFVGSSVVLRTLHGEPFVAVYEVSAQLGQPEIVICIETAKNNTGTE